MAHVRSLPAATPSSAPVDTTSGSPAAEAETSFPSVHAERDAETAQLLAALAAAPDGRSRAVALERIVLLYLDLCGSMASRYDGRGIEHDDLVQVARLALVKAIDRYVVYPGQATAYMVGKLKIEELRGRAREKLGAKYDDRGFHDTVLLAGSKPLDLLEKRVDEWIAGQQ